MIISKIVFDKIQHTRTKTLSARQGIEESSFQRDKEHVQKIYS